MLNDNWARGPAGFARRLVNRLALARQRIDATAEEAAHHAGHEHIACNLGVRRGPAGTMSPCTPP